MKRISVTVPTKWSELSQEQLRFLLSTIIKVQNENQNAVFASQEEYAAETAAQVATLCLLQWTGLSVICPCADGYLFKLGEEEFLLTTEIVASAIRHLAWINEIPDLPVRLEKVDGATAAPADISSGFSFDSWLSCENLWQAYQSTQDIQWLHAMAEILYSKEGIRLGPEEALGVFYWWAALKNLVSEMFPNFFKSVGTGDNVDPPSVDDLRRNIDAQIRALTKGDITKERDILAMDAIRALTELDAQAREYDELNKKYSSK